MIIIVWLYFDDYEIEKRRLRRKRRGRQDRDRGEKIDR